jgi:hypothetical protein
MHPTPPSVLRDRCLNHTARKRARQDGMLARTETKERTYGERVTYYTCNLRSPLNDLSEPCCKMENLKKNHIYHVVE